MPRRNMLVATVAVPVVAGLLTGCGSGGARAVQPAGLSGRQVAGRSTYTAEDRAAATSLSPAAGSFLAGRTTVTALGSTTPANGDINPYAIWPVSRTIGSVTVGDVLVDNFNNASNNQGTGTTIVDVHSNGQLTVFAQLAARVAGCPGGVGLTTAMVQLRSGWVMPVIPTTAHVRVASPRSNGGATMLRRAFSYTNGTTTFVERWPPWRQALEYDAGLLFLAYQKDPRTAFVPVYSQMAEVDALSQFTTHTASAVFAVPPGSSGPHDFFGSGLLT